MTEPKKLTEAEPHVVHVTAEPVAEDLVWCDEAILAARLAPVEAERHAVHVTAAPVAEDLVWCDECEEWVASGAPEPDSSLVAALRQQVADLTAERDYLRDELEATRLTLVNTGNERNAAKATAAAQDEAIALVLRRYEDAAKEAPGHVYSGPWLSMVDDLRRELAALDGPAPQAEEGDTERLAGRLITVRHSETCALWTAQAAGRDCVCHVRNSLLAPPTTDAEEA